MIRPRLQAGVATFALLALVAPFAFGQSRSDPNAGKEWDPISGFAGGDATGGSSISGGRLGSPWSFPKSSLNSDFAGGYESPATIGGITFSGDGRRCGGMFRMTAC